MQHYLLKTMKVFLHVLREYTVVVTFYAQNPALETVYEQSVKIFLHYIVQRECLAGPFMRSILCH